MQVPKHASKRPESGRAFRPAWAGRCAVPILLAFSALALVRSAPAQTAPVYAFVSFEKSYASLLGSARSSGYQVKEGEVNSPYGKYTIKAEKALSFYKEELYLFFNEKKEPVYFTVRFVLAENQSKAVLERLVQSIRDKLIAKYGPGERANFPYFKVVENKYEVALKPRQYTSTYADNAFKHLQRFDAYQAYYIKEVQRLENEEISKTVKNF